MVVAGAVVVAVGVVAAATAVEAATVVDAVANAVPLGANGRKLHNAFNSILHIICSVKIDSAERSSLFSHACSYCTVRIQPWEWLRR